MKNMAKIFLGRQPWRNALIATTGLSLFFMVSSLLWKSGHAEWAFLLGFLAVWTLLSTSWSNMRYVEESGAILAKIVDDNFSRLFERIEQLEQELPVLRGEAGISHQRANPDGGTPRLP